MHFTCSSLGSVLILLSLCHSTVAFPTLWGSRLESSLEKRNVCVYDDYLLSLNAFLPDTQPFCSSYLSIPLVTTTGDTTTVRTYVQKCFSATHHPVSRANTVIELQQQFRHQ